MRRGDDPLAGSTNVGGTEFAIGNKKVRSAKTVTGLKSPLGISNRYQRQAKSRDLRAGVVSSKNCIVKTIAGIIGKVERTTLANFSESKVQIEFEKQGDDFVWISKNKKVIKLYQFYRFGGYAGKLPQGHPVCAVRKESNSAAK